MPLVNKINWAVFQKGGEPRDYWKSTLKVWLLGLHSQKLLPPAQGKEGVGYCH